MNFFSNILLKWFVLEKRDLPWKSTNQAYHIWISEIILQQTRVDQGIAYYHRFIKTFPTLRQLANAEEDAVMKLWEGLGYYSRARNLHHTAQYIVEKYQGRFPETYEEILQLKGIGPYTAAAIMSYAYNKPYAVVDGNVLRIVSRFLGIHDAIDASATIKRIQDWVQSHIDHLHAGDFNQAMMDLGATVCTPKNPQCAICPLNAHCAANAHGWQSIIPYKSKKIIKSNAYFHYLVIADRRQSLLVKKREDGIWKSLYEFPLIENNKPNTLTAKTIENWMASIIDVPIDLTISDITRMDKHILTHKNIYTIFYQIEVSKDTLEKLKKIYTFVHRAEWQQLAFPKIINSFLALNNEAIGNSKHNSIKTKKSKK